MFSFFVRQDTDWNGRADQRRAQEVRPSAHFCEDGELGRLTVLGPDLCRVTPPDGSWSAAVV